MAFQDLQEGIAAEFAQASGRGREWFDSDGFGTRRLPKLRDPEFVRQVRLLEVRRTEAKKPDLYGALHKKAARRRTPRGSSVRRTATASATSRRPSTPAGTR